MTNIPIQKTILATLAFAFSTWKKLLEACIFPLLMTTPLITILPELLRFMDSANDPGVMFQTDVNFPIVYLLMFIYATLALLVNIYRIVISGNKSISKLGVVAPNLRLGRFFLLSIPLTIGQIISIFLPILFPIIYLLLIPCLLYTSDAADE